MHFSMIAINHDGPLISKALAEGILRLIIRERYPSDLFYPDHDVVITDNGDYWNVTFKNNLTFEKENEGLPIINGKIVPLKLTFSIKKSNCEIISIE